MSTASDISQHGKAREALPVRRALPRRWVRPLALLFGPALLIAIGAWLYLSGGRYISTDDAYVHAGMTQISTDVSGRVAEVAVVENQRVKVGDLLFRLDDRPYRYAVERAEAQLARTRLTIDALRATYAQKQADIRVAQEDVEYLARELERQRQLLASHVASQAAFDQARHKYDAARQTLSAAQQALANVVANLGGNPNIATDQHPDVQAAKAQLDQAEYDLAHTRIYAESNGVVARVDKLQRGSYVTPGTPLFALIGSDDLWVEANFKETELTHMKPGQRAIVEVDTYPGRSFIGTIEGISPGTGSEFSVLPAQNASGNWVKVVQRLPVRIRLAETDADAPLRAGMSATVEVDTEQKRSLGSLFHSAFAATRPTSR